MLSYLTLKRIFLQFFFIQIIKDLTQLCFLIFSKGMERGRLFHIQKGNLSCIWIFEFVY